MKKIIKYISIFIVMLSGLVLTGCESISKEANTVNHWNQIKKDKVVKIGIDDSFVPMDFQNKEGKITGYDADLAKAVFRQYGIKVSFQTIDWSMNATELRNDTIDAIWNGFSITPQRKKTLSFSIPYLDNEQKLITLKKSNINSFNNMKGKVLGTQSGSSGLNDISEHPKVLKDKIKDNQPVLYDSIPNSFIDLNAHRIDGMLTDSTYGNYYINHERNPKDYSTTTGNFPKEQFAVGMRKGDVTMRNKVNQGLKRLAKNGQLKKLNEKWFGKNYDSPLLK